ncbi:uncharacterized protein LOC128237826 [Mya arenaria]|uniref:uncharacterized protein LOC128237826 n=1 Tax=Mya arenaria TaxID=6604 RepID=UPI0022E38F23|nr:uncharacterized protein LOC128237826 [Mya arenaria]
MAAVQGQPQVLKFKEQWVEGDQQAWNHFNNGDPSTTNHVEGWHHKINNQMKNCHPNIYILLDIIKKEQAANEAKISQHANGGKQRPRKRVYRQLEERLVRLKDQLSIGEMDTMSYVDAVSR